MSRSLLAAMVCALLSLVMSLPLRAEGIVADMSDRVIKISSNFTGSRIVVFGMIERDSSTIARADPYDVVIVVRGWDQHLISRRKERVVGIWVNNEKRRFPTAPNFYVMSSTRKLVDIAQPDLLAKLQLGTNSLLQPPGYKAHPDSPNPDPFRKAALRLKREEGLYRDDLSTIAFLNDAMFRSTVDIPANVEVGKYDVTVHLFRGGALLHSETQPLNVSKTGFEQMMYSLAHQHQLVYGSLCVIIAVFTGWFAGVVFRKN